MKNKRLAAGLALLMVGVVMAIYWLARDGREAASVAGDKAKTEQQQAAQLEEIKRLQKQDPNQAVALAKKLYDSLPEKVQRYYNLGFNAGIEEVAFYGRVLDQQGEAVAGARVRFEVGGRYLAGGSGFGALLTDNDGRFHLRGKGGSLTIDEITHPDIDEYRYRTPDGQIGGRPGFWGYQHTEGGNDFIWSDYTEENPYVFTVWRKTDDSLATKLFQDDQTFDFSCDGAVYTFDFTKKKAAEMQKKGAADGQLRVRYHCEAQQHFRYMGDWSVEIEAVDGGIQETSDVYLNQAPEAGYQSVYKIEMKQGEPDYQGRVTKQFYFSAHGDQFHGSIIATFEPYIPNKPPLIFMDYKVNPTRSQALLLNKARR